MSDTAAVGEIAFNDFRKATHAALAAEQEKFTILDANREEDISLAMQTFKTGWLWWKRPLTREEAIERLFPYWRAYTDWDRSRSRIKRLEALRDSFKGMSIRAVHIPENDIRLFNEYL